MPRGAVDPADVSISSRSPTFLDALVAIIVASVNALSVNALSVKALSVNAFIQ
jgi:hypothetical protein